jgi:DNA-binding Lrp family transcriptional regulator
MAAKRPPALDRIDVKILAALQRDGRSTIQKLAQAVGLSPRASLERVRRLEGAGVIAGYQAVVELARLARPRSSWRSTPTAAASRSASPPSTRWSSVGR